MVWSLGLFIHPHTINAFRDRSSKVEDAVFVVVEALDFCNRAPSSSWFHFEQKRVACAAVEFFTRNLFFEVEFHFYEDALLVEIVCDLFELMTRYSLKLLDVAIHFFGCVDAFIREKFALHVFHDNLDLLFW